MKNRIMLDLETFGNKPEAVIASIGAQRFDESRLLDSFHYAVDVVDCERWGLRCDASTMLWWLEQNEDARVNMITADRNPLKVVLEWFQEWAQLLNRDGYTKVDEIWCKGASFDFAILATAYDRTKLDKPWEYWAERCLRTMVKKFPDPKLRVYPDVAHDALEDARAQAQWLLNIEGAHCGECAGALVV